MESLQDQIAYGNHCVHGTPIGTPGGIDLMCGDCEQGWTWWVESPRYGLYVVDDSGLASGSLVEWSDPLTEDAAYVDLAWSRILDIATMAANAEPPVNLEIRQTRAGYWDEPPSDSASHQAAGHELPANGAEGYCLTCYHDLSDIESWHDRALRLLAERKDVIEDIRAYDMLTDDERDAYADEVWTLKLAVLELKQYHELHPEVARYIDELIAVEDENLAYGW